jgi:seryl-tRNA synthetase
MIDMKLVRENPGLVKDNLKKRFKKDQLKLVDEVLKLDEKWRKLKFDEDKLRAERNAVSKKISELKKAKKSADAELKKAKKIPEEIEKIQEKRSKLEKEIKEIM